MNIVCSDVLLVNCQHLHIAIKMQLTITKTTQRLPLFMQPTRVRIKAL